MSNGNTHQYDGDKVGIEIGKTKTCYLLSPVNSTWPFPSKPVEVKKTECVLLKKIDSTSEIEEGLF